MIIFYLQINPEQVVFELEGFEYELLYTKE